MRFHDRFASSLRGGRFAGRFGAAVAGPVPTFYYPDGEASFTPTDVQTSGATPTWKFFDVAGALEAEYTALEPTHNFVGTGPYRIELHNGQDLTRLYLNSMPISGDIASLSTLTSLSLLQLYTTQVSGDISSLSTLTSLTDLRLYNTQVSGDISSLSTLTSPTLLNLSRTNVSGDVGDLSTLTSLTYLHLGDSNVSGDVGDLSTLTSLTYLILYETNVSGALDIDAVTGIRYVTVADLGLSQTEVDNSIDNIYQARAAFTDATPDLYIGGTNAAPSGTYQYAATPSTGKEKIYALVNDPDTEGFNTWTITYTA